MIKNNVKYLGGGFFITLLLFLLLQALVRQTDEGLEATAAFVAKIDFLPVARDKAQKPPSRKPPRVKQTQTKSPPPLSQINPPPMPAPLTARPQIFSLSLLKQKKLSLLHNFSAGVDGGALPLARVPPLYPARALQQGTEGWVLIEFSINKKGEVIAPRIIQAEPPFIFNRAALDAIVQWKYKPQVVEGKVQAQHAIQTRIIFQLEQ